MSKNDPNDLGPTGSDSGERAAVSEIALEIRRLHQASVRALEKRARLPQPLFWSLFHDQLRSVKVAKDRARLVRSILDDL